MVVLSVVGGITILHQANGQATATQPADAADIQLGTATKDYPNLVSPLIENGTLKDGHHGPPIGVQEFQYNPATHEVSLSKNSPVEQQPYANTEIDAASFNQDLSVLSYVTTDRATIGKIVLLCANKKLYVSTNYVVTIMKDDPATPDPSAYCADVQFVKGDECNKPGTTVTFRRNDDPPAALADSSFTKIHRKTDVITWTIDRGGAVIKTGSFGFPVVGAEPNLVKYVIQLP
jgi:hypothetical protein